MSGRSTASGVAFQARVGAYVAALMLAERPLSSLAQALPGAPTRILFETPAPVDDVLVETNVGEIYVQAKNSISLSDKPDSELASVAQQFVRQYCEKSGSQSTKRSFLSAQDRLVLAVGEETPATIRDHLREALERNATNAATAFPQTLDKAFTTFSNQIGLAWLEETKTPILPQDLTAILSLCRVISLRRGDERRIVEILSHIVAVLENGTALWNVLKDWAVDASSKGTGADLPSLREYLALEGGVRLAVAPSFRDDVKKLKAHSSSEFQRVGRFRTLITPEGDISINRLVTDAVVTAASRGSFLITGEPGSGKSAVLHAAAEALAASAPVVFLSVDETATSLDVLRREIGLEHRITEVLGAFDDNRPAFLFIDALDAVRGGAADAVYRKLIEEVSALDGWHVIASIRSFDLRMGRELRNLLSGPPPEQQFTEKTFGTVRHIHVPVLSDMEIELICVKSATVAFALKNADTKLKELVRNPFNLGLLSGLLNSGVQASELVSISTRGQLLERYGTERMDDIGLGAEIALSKITSAMLDRRVTALDITLLDPANANIVEENLVAPGLLVRESANRLAFRHHVLYDFAIARFVLSLDEKSALDRCSRASGAGLLLAPSLGYWLDERFRNAAPTDFWRLVISLTATNEVDPIIRVESARLAVELVAQPKDLDCLADAVLAKPNGLAVQATIHLVGAVLTRAFAGWNIAPIPWANFAARLRPLPHRLLFATGSLLKVLLEPNPAPETLDALGLAAREVMDALLADESLASTFASQAIGFVARTYSTDPESSRDRLARLFEPGRFSRIGYIEAPKLAHEIRAVAATDPAFAIEIYRRIFSAADFDHTQKTSMGNSWILSMNSNARQDFNIARYHLSEAYRGIIESDATTSIRILIAVIESEITLKYPCDESNQPQGFTVNDQSYSLIEDRSHIWAWNIEKETNHDDYAKIVGAFLYWISEARPEQQLSAVETLLRESSMALIWRCAFIAGASQPTSLGLKLWPFVARPEFLFSMDTRQSSISLIAAIYPHLSIHDRDKYETETEGFDFSVLKNSETAQSKILSRLYAAIGKENLATNSALERLRAAVERGESLENKRLFEVLISSRECGHHDWIRGNTSIPPNSDILALNDRIEQVLSAFKDSPTPTPNGLVELAADIQELDRLVESVRTDGLLTDVDRMASDTLARGAQAVLTAPLNTEVFREDFIQLLLRLSEHPLPETVPETEADFAKSPSWSCPCPRLHAAEAIASIMTLPEVWPRVTDAVERLALRDTHPAVRMMVINRLSGLWQEQRDEMWRLVEEVSRQEQNPVVIRSLLSPVLWKLRGVEQERAETLYLQIIDHITSYSQGEDSVADLLVYFAIDRNLSLSRTRLDDWISKFDENEEWLQATLHRIRDLVVLGYENMTNDDVEIGKRARALAIAALDRIEPALRSWPIRGGEPTPEEQIAFKLLRTITDVFFYGTGAGRENEGAVIKTHVGQAAFLKDNAELIRRITQLGTPYSVHHMLELLEAMVPADPVLCFDLISEALLRPAGVARYEHEPLGANLFVKLIGRYLADYRGLFRDDVRSRRLVDCIAVFVEAGWPEARCLFQHLPELLS